MNSKLVIISFLTLLFSGCAGMGGLEIDTGKGDSIKWSLPDENCIQTGMLTLKSGLKVKRFQKAKDCVPKTVAPAG